MAIELINEAGFKALGQTFALESHFTEADSLADFNNIQTDTDATVALDADGVGGVVLLTTGATDNNEAYLYSNEIHDIAEGKTNAFCARISYSESTTDDANVVVGFMSGVAANHLVDNGGGLVSSFTGAAFYKVDGETRWRVKSSIGTTSTDTETNITAGGGYQTFAVLITPTSSTTAKVDYFCDPNGGVDLKPIYEQGSDGRDRIISHTVTYASATEMAGLVGVKAGSASSEVVSVDYYRSAGVV